MSVQILVSDLLKKLEPLNEDEWKEIGCEVYSISSPMVLIHGGDRIELVHVYPDADVFLIGREEDPIRVLPTDIITVDLSVQIDQDVAEFIEELLSNAGWMDDPDELVLDEYDESGYEETLNHVRIVDKTIRLINQLLPKRIDNDHSMEDELNDCVEYRKNNPLSDKIKSY